MTPKQNYELNDIIHFTFFKLRYFFPISFTFFTFIFFLGDKTEELKGAGDEYLTHVRKVTTTEKSTTLKPFHNHIFQENQGNQREIFRII